MNRVSPEQSRAYNKVYHAVKTGKLIKSDVCNKCGRSDKQIEGHHEDYNKPLEILWICQGCHKQLRSDNSPKGEEHYSAKLTEKDVISIRFRYAAKNISQSALAREYGISQPSIHGILHMKTWKHLAGQEKDG